MEGLFSLLIFAALFFVMMRFGCGAHMAHGHGGHGGHDAQRGDASPAEKARNTEVDPVCGMTVPVDTGYGKMHAGKLYRFCSRECLDRFDAAPERYMTSEETNAQQQAM